jgi:hypothetical protein
MVIQPNLIALETVDLPDGRVAQKAVQFSAQKYFCFSEAKNGLWSALSRLVCRATVLK